MTHDTTITDKARGSGVLLHPTSLPGPYGIGDLGPVAYRFVDTLVEAGQRYWQILPLGPTGYGDSPYQTFSAFAGNPLLISPQRLVADALLPASALDATAPFPAGTVDFATVIPYKRQLLQQSFAHFERTASAEQRRAVERFAGDHAAWLDDYALFMALKDAHDQRPWTEWEPELIARDMDALSLQRAKLDHQIRLHAYGQYLFFQQWTALREYAHARDLLIIGDAPIFVAHDSADCWSHRDLFFLAPDGKPTFVAGVPPDYFSATGQLWGNPLYNWDIHEATGYTWWIERLRITLDLVDLLRLDHFRGFAGYWAIPGDAPTAVTGSWQPGPGAAFFEAVQAALGKLPLIAEDLGVITPDVEELRDGFDFPGMRVLQFAFGGDAKNHDLPHNYIPRCVVYTGTHDNDTTAGWFATQKKRTREHVLSYTKSDGSDVVWDLIRLAYSSVAETAIVPLQDLLRLGSSARMNYPGRPAGNWSWRFTEEQLTPELIAAVAELAILYGRFIPLTSFSSHDEEKEE